MLRTNDRLRKYIGAFALILFLFTGTQATAEEKVNYNEQAKVKAEAARTDAKKAMAEAEAAISLADDAIAKAYAIKDAAEKNKKNALEKMVSAQYFPDDIDLTITGEKGQTTAVFSHKNHTEREKLHCIECHPRVFKMKVGDALVKGSNLTMQEMQKGKFCGNCHNGEKAFDVTSITHCKKCHPTSKQ